LKSARREALDIIVPDLHSGRQSGPPALCVRPPPQTKEEYMRPASLLVLALTCGLLAPSAALGGEPATSPSNKAVARSEPSPRAFNTLITFSEFPVGTQISNQYANLGIIFGGDSPFIANDSSNPTSPVLSGTPQFFGAIEGSFVRTDNGKKTSLARFKMDAGYFDATGTVRITLYDRKGNVILTQKNTQLGIQTFDFKNLPKRVQRFRIEVRGSEDAGFAIDNIAFKRKPPPP
jgi:hypothetical protein